MPISVKDMLEQTVSSVEAHPADDSFAPPVSSVKLPSRGLVYPSESPLYLCDSVDIKAVTAKEEDILSSQALIKKGIVLTTLMRACITNRLVDPEAMLVGDRNAVLVAIRVSAYGPKYNCRVVCPECGDDCEHAFDLSRLKLRELAVEPAGGPGSNEFSFTLPVSKKEVRFKLMDAAMVAKLDKDITAIRKQSGAEPGVTMRLMSQVTSIAGVERKDLSRVINNLPARDSRALRQHMTEIAPDVDMTQDFECPSCGKVTEVEIPVGTEFFWPSSSE
jgi:rRNA maturation protein Nop10